MSNPASSSSSSSVGNYRWVICSLLLFSTTINYMDRQVISYLKEFFCTPIEQGGFGWSNTDFRTRNRSLHRVLCGHDHLRRHRHR